MGFKQCNEEKAGGSKDAMFEDNAWCDYYAENSEHGDKKVRDYDEHTVSLYPAKLHYASF